MSIESRIEELIDIPTYSKKYINPEWNLDEEPLQYCPWHEDGSKKSWSFSKERGVFRCFGQCKVGGNVIALHQKNFNLHSKDEAIESLRELLKIPKEEISFKIRKPEVVNNFKVDYDTAYLLALRKAEKSDDDFIELAYIMSQSVSKSEVLDALNKYIEKH